VTVGNASAWRHAVPASPCGGASKSLGNCGWPAAPLTDGAVAGGSPGRRSGSRIGRGLKRSPPPPPSRHADAARGPAPSSSSVCSWRQPNAKSAGPHLGSPAMAAESLPVSSFSRPSTQQPAGRARGLKIQPVWRHDCSGLPSRRQPWPPAPCCRWLSLGSGPGPWGCSDRTALAVCQQIRRSRSGNGSGTESGMIQEQKAPSPKRSRASFAAASRPAHCPGSAGSGRPWRLFRQHPLLPLHAEGPAETVVAGAVLRPPPSKPVSGVARDQGTDPHS